MNKDIQSVKRYHISKVYRRYDLRHPSSYNTLGG